MANGTATSKQATSQQKTKTGQQKGELTRRVREGLGVLGTECTFPQMKEWLKKNYKLDIPNDSVFYVARNEARAAASKTGTDNRPAGEAGGDTKKEATVAATTTPTTPVNPELPVNEATPPTTPEVIELDTVTEVLPQLRAILSSLKGRKDVAKRLIDAV